MILHVVFSNNFIVDQSMTANPRSITSQGPLTRTFISMLEMHTMHAMTVHLICQMTKMATTATARWRQVLGGFGKTRRD
jgi:hypothetical protein